MFEGNALLDETLERWELSSDKGLPRTLMGIKLRHLLSKTANELLKAKGFGIFKFAKLVVVVERAIQEICEQHIANKGTLRPPSDQHEQRCKEDLLGRFEVESTTHGNTSQKEIHTEDKQAPYIRYENARLLFSKLQGSSLSCERLKRWVLPTDTHLPSNLIDLPLSVILSKSYMALLQTTGVGELKLGKMVALVERALQDIATKQETERLEPDNTQRHSERNIKSFKAVDVPPVNYSGTSANAIARGISLSKLTNQSWTDICNYIKIHGLECYPLGRFAETLAELPLSLWNCQLSEFVNQSHHELMQMRGYGEQRITSVLRVLVGVMELCAKSPIDTHLRINASALRINQVTGWLQGVIQAKRLPDYSSLCNRMALPLLQQLEIDLGSQTTEMIKRRLGVQSEAETLQDIAEDFGLTRERIRQLTLRATKVMNVRWPEGHQILNTLHNAFRRAVDAEPQIALIQRAQAILFDAEADCQITRDDVIREWDVAGRNKETPMSENQILVWLAGIFPDLMPAQGVKWITSESLFVQYEGRRLYFSNDECDRLLHQLFQSSRAAPIHELVNVGEREQRNFRMKLLRDLRFTEDEDHCFMPTEFYGFSRDSIGWHVTLEAESPEARPRSTFISVESIVAAALGGFAQAKILDVTVWGFHRFVNEQLKLLYNAKLPNTISPFILGDMVVRQSGKQIRPMRRRRLRWDSSNDASKTARGKRGWVGFVVQRQGVPILIDELPNLLKEFYQDYEPSAIDQLNLDSDEEGEVEYGATLHPCVVHKLPAILVPDGWSLDQDRDNVSPGVGLSIVRAISLLRDDKISFRDLDHLPWFVELIRRNSYGERELGSRIGGGTQRSVATEAMFQQQKFEFNDLWNREIASASAGVGPELFEPQKNIDDLLKRFL